MTGEGGEQQRKKRGMAVTAEAADFRPEYRRPGWLMHSLTS
jgi:hypothetical protein